MAVCCFVTKTTRETLILEANDDGKTCTLKHLCTPIVKLSVFFVFFFFVFFLFTFLTVKVDWARGEKPQNVYGIVVKYILQGNLSYNMSVCLQCYMLYLRGMIDNRRE